MSRSGEVGRQHLRKPRRRATSSGRPRQVRHCRTRAAPRRTSRYRARSPADRGSQGVEEDAGIERRTDLDTAVGEALEQNGAPPASIETSSPGAASAPRSRSSSPHHEGRPGVRAFGLGVHEEHALGGIDLLEERRVRLRLEQAEALTDVPAKPSRTCHGANAWIRPPDSRTTSRMPSTQASSSASRAAASSAWSPRVVWSETTATSISSRSSAARRCARSWTRRSSSPVPLRRREGGARRNGTGLDAEYLDERRRQEAVEVEARSTRADLRRRARRVVRAWQRSSRRRTGRRRAPRCGRSSGRRAARREGRTPAPRRTARRRQRGGRARPGR